MEIKDFTITKRDGSKDRFSLDKIMGAICKAFETVDKPTDLGTVAKVLNHLDLKDGITIEDIQNQVEESLMNEGLFKVAKSFIMSRDRRHDNPGRPTIVQLCPRWVDRDTCRLFSWTWEEMRQYTSDPTQQVVCFFNAIFAYMETEVPLGKIAHYYRILCKYIRGFRIPRLRTIQNAIRMYTNWKNRTMMWLFKESHHIKYKAWSALQDMIEGLLPKLEPQLAVSTI
jgi:hypothetical protein